MDVSIEEPRERVLIIKIDGELVATTAAEFSRKAALLPSPDPKAVIFDLQAVKYLDSSGLGALIGLSKDLTGRGVKVILSRPSELVERILTLTRLHRIYDIFSTLEEAEAAVSI